MSAQYITQIQIGADIRSIRDQDAQDSITTINGDISDINGDIGDINTALLDKVDTADIAGFKNITISDTSPTSDQGSNGDLWIVYDPNAEPEDESGSGV